jgi:hypothetical protein
MGSGARDLACSWLDPSAAGDRARWTQLLAGTRHDFHHLPDYLALEAERLGGRGLALIVEDPRAKLERAALLPLILRPVPGPGPESGPLDAISPYGYPGPLFTATDPDFMGAAVEALAAGLRERGLVSAFVRLHPLLPTPTAALARVGELVEHGPTVWIDLEADEDTQWAGYRSTHRNLIRRAKREGLEVRFDEDFARLEDFYEVYAQTMVRLEADWADMGRDYLAGLAEVLRGRGFLALVEHAGEVIAGGVFSSCSGIVEYHLSGTATSWRRASPTRLLLDEVRRRQAARGDWRMHLGGGVGAREDALFRFKRGFSRERGGFASWRVIADVAAHQELVAAWETGGGSREAAGGFFPLYRAPLPKTPEASS